MSRSEPKPKIIYKNLQDLIKNNSLSKNGSTKRYNTQRVHTQTLADISNTNLPNNNHSANKNELKQTKYIKITRTQANDTAQHNPRQTNSVGLYSQCYNEIDAIFTELQDFFCQSKQKVLEQVRNMLRNRSTKKREDKKIKQKVDDIKKMSDYIKHISKFFIEGEIPDVLTNNMQQNNFSLTKNKVSTNPNNKSTVPTEIYEDQSNKLTTMSLKNSKIRANRRGQLMNNRKKTIYELILQQKQSKLRSANSMSKKNLQVI